MDISSKDPGQIKLSICIATFNRAPFLREALDSILPQIQPGCEIVISDNASSDNTEEVATGYARNFDCLKYARNDENLGPDRNFDRAVLRASGEYCWLMSDDDLIKPGAVASVLQALARDPSLVIVNSEIRDITLSSIFLEKYHKATADRLYASDQMELLFTEVGGYTAYIGCVVIRRSIWVERDRERYYGSNWLHVAVLYQKPFPGNVLVLANPLVIHRLGNESALKDIFNLSSQWISVVWSLPISESAKMSAADPNGWRKKTTLLFYRAIGAYTLNEYRERVRPQMRSAFESMIPCAIALLPNMVANAILLLTWSLTPKMRATASRAVLKQKWTARG